MSSRFPLQDKVPESEVKKGEMEHFNWSPLPDTCGTDSLAQGLTDNLRTDSRVGLVHQ